MDKKYGLIWEPQTEQVIEQLKTNRVYLEEDESLRITQDPDNPKSNVLIEGDNYEALTYMVEEGQKVDVIYIEPPYNTGNNGFIYNDRFINKNDEYRHSKWLSFMNKRLRLARELMTDEGVIFISIDDNEQAQLKLLCDQVFGEQNFVSNMIWKSKSGGANDVSTLAVDHEYVLVYTKEKEKVVFSKKESTGTDYKLEDERGKYRLEKLDRTSLGYLSSLDFPIEVEGKVGIPGGTEEENKKKKWRWRWGKESVEWGIENNLIVLKKDRKTKTYSVYTKTYEKYNLDIKGKKIEPTDVKTIPYRSYIDEYRTTEGNKEIRELFDESVFSYPKPKGIVKHLVNLHPNKNAIVLDFFAGSGTTAHAVMELNKEDGGKRQFILVTNNENNIARDVTYERNKRVIEGYTTPNGKEVKGIPSNLAYYRAKQVPKQ